MSKCVSSRTLWRKSIIFLEDTSFLADEPRIGENLLNLKIDNIKVTTNDIVNDFMKIKLSCFDYDHKWDCYQIQDSLMTKLDKLLTDIPSITEHIKSSKLISATKHRYFLHFSCGIIDKLKQLLIMVGRLNDLDQKIYFQEQRKPLISEESITIHCLIAIWSASIETMNSFREPAEEIFKEQFASDEYSFLKNLDFWICGTEYSRIFAFDLIITSWLQFNRLVKFNDLLKSMPFLCPCSSKNFIRTLEIMKCNNSGVEEEIDDMVTSDDFCNDSEILLQLLSLILDHKAKPSLLTQNLRQHNIVPIEPCFVGTNQTNLAYFLIWHLYTLIKIMKTEKERQILENCDIIMISSFDLAMEQFKSKTQIAGDNNPEFRLSPHQEERFKLIFIMIDKWLEFNSIKDKDSTDKKDHNNKRIELLMKMFTFFQENWSLFGENYFNKPEFKIGGLTIFQLFTKHVYEVIPIQTDQDGHAATVQSNLSKEEQKLGEIWDKLLERTCPVGQSKMPTAQSAGKQNKE